MSFDVLTKQLSYWTMLLVTSGSIGALVSLVLFLGSKECQLKIKDYRSLIKIKVIVPAVLIAALSTVFIRQNHISKDVLVGLSIVILSTLALRFVRMYKASNISANKLHLLTLADLSIFGSSIVFLKLWVYIMLSNRGYFSPVNIFGTPAFYVLLCWYIIFNCNLICPEKVKLSTWRLVAYAFPEGNEHRKGHIGKPHYYGLRVIDVLSWSLFLVTVLSAFLFAYWFAGYLIAVIVYFVTVPILMVVIIVKKGSLRTAVDNKLYASVLGGGLVVIVAGIMILFSWIKLHSPDTIERCLLAIAISTPFISLSVQFVPQILDKLWNRWESYLKQDRTYEAIRAVADSAQVSIFGGKRLRVLQALLVSAVFMLYFVVPKIGPLLYTVGFTEINGKPVLELIAEFQEIASTWIIPKKWTNEEPVGFMFGNYGLVLLFLSWSGITFIVCVTEAPDCLEKVPNLIHSRLDKFLFRVHMLLFYLFFLPFLFWITFLIPHAGSTLLGYSFAILLGVFAFGLFLPKLQVRLLSLGYLILAIIDTDVKRDAIDINTSTENQLTLLPGIGTNLAKRIIETRPYSEINNLTHIKGLGVDKLEVIRDLIRV